MQIKIRKLVLLHPPINQTLNEIWDYCAILLGACIINKVYNKHSEISLTITSQFCKSNQNSLVLKAMHSVNIKNCFTTSDTFFFSQQLSKIELIHQLGERSVWITIPPSSLTAYLPLTKKVSFVFLGPPESFTHWISYHFLSVNDLYSRNFLKQLYHCTKNEVYH